MNTWMGGMVDKTISYEVYNGFNSYRKLYHQQLFEIEHQTQMLMQ